MSEIKDSDVGVVRVYGRYSRKRDLTIGVLLISISLALILGLYVSREIDTIHRMVLGLVPLLTDVDFVIISSSLVLGAVGFYYLGKRFVNGRETRPYSAALVGVTAFLLSLNVLVFSQSTRGQEAVQSYAGLADIYEVAKYAGIGSAAVVALGVALLLLYRKGIVSGSSFSP